MGKKIKRTSNIILISNNMEITAKINTDERNDIRYIVEVAKALETTQHVIDAENEAGATAPARTEEPAEVAEEKPKRKPRAKKEAVAEEPATPVEPQAKEVSAVEDAPAEETPTEAPDEEPVSDLPFDQPETAPVEAPADAPKTADMPAWRKALAAKRAELKIDAGLENERLIDVFSEYCRTVCSFYGDRSPAKLTPEARYRFIEEVKTIGIEDDSFVSVKCPF